MEVQGRQNSLALTEKVVGAHVKTCRARQSSERAIFTQVLEKTMPQMSTT